MTAIDNVEARMRETRSQYRQMQKPMIESEGVVSGTETMVRPDLPERGKWPKRVVHRAFKKIRGSETEMGIPRSPTNRFDREAMSAVVQAIQGETPVDPTLLDEFTSRASVVQAKNELLDEQSWTNGVFIDTGKGLSRHHSLYAVRYDGRDPEVRYRDSDVPTFFIAGAASVPEQNRTLIAAEAIGEKKELFAFEYRQQRQEKTGRRSIPDRFLNPTEKDVEGIVSGIISSGRKEIDLAGESLGAAYIVRVAADTRLKEAGVKIRNIDIFQPVGFESRKVTEMGKVDLPIGKRNESDPEFRTIMVDQGNDAAYEGSFAQLHKMPPVVKEIKGILGFTSVAKAAGTHIVTSEVLREAVQNSSGQVRIIAGDLDKVSRLSAILPTVIETGVWLSEEDRNRLSVVVVRGADHTDIVIHAVGLLRALGEGKKDMDLDDLETTWAERILKEIKNGASETTSSI